MHHERLVETAIGLRDGLKGSNIPPPYEFFVPKGTNLDAQYVDGFNVLGTLKERLLRIDGIEKVIIGDGSGCSLVKLDSSDPSPL